MVFKPGNKANPLGGGVNKAHQKRLARDLLSPYGPKAVKEVVAQLEAEETKDRQWAVETIMSYAYGKPSQGVELTGANGEALSITVSIVKEAK